MTGFGMGFWMGWIGMVGMGWVYRFFFLGVRTVGEGLGILHWGGLWVHGWIVGGSLWLRGMK